MLILQPLTYAFNRLSRLGLIPTYDSQNFLQHQSNKNNSPVGVKWSQRLWSINSEGKPIRKASSLNVLGRLDRFDRDHSDWQSGIVINAMSAGNANITHRLVYRRTDDHTQGTPKIKIVTEPLPLPLSASEILIKVHAVALNYRDANIAHGGNPWPVIPHGIIGNDAAGEVILVGENVKSLKVGDRVAPNTDTENITGQEPTRSWLAADEDGVLADYLVYDERVLGRLPAYLSWTQASTIPCAGVTAWCALKGARVGQSVLIQGEMNPFHLHTIVAIKHLVRYWWGRHVLS